MTSFHSDQSSNQVVVLGGQRLVTKYNDFVRTWKPQAIDAALWLSIEKATLLLNITWSQFVQRWQRFLISLKIEMLPYIKNYPNCVKKKMCAFTKYWSEKTHSANDYLSMVSNCPMMTTVLNHLSDKNSSLQRKIILIKSTWWVSLKNVVLNIRIHRTIIKYHVALKCAAKLAFLNHT